MLSKKKESFISKKQYNKKKLIFLSDKGVFLENSIDLSLCPWRDSNEVTYLVDKPRLLGPFFKYNLDGPEGVDYHVLYISYLQKLKYILSVRKAKIDFWGGAFGSFYEHSKKDTFHFLSVHFLYFRDLWLRPTSILDVWTNEEEIMYVHISYYKLHYYGWSNPRLFVNLVFPIITDFSYFFDLFKGPVPSFIGYERNEYITYSYSLREKLQVFNYYFVPALTKENFLLNEFWPLGTQENYKNLDWQFSPYFLLYDQFKLSSKLDLFNFYYLSFYYLRQSFFLQAIFLDSVGKKTFQYGLLGYFFFNSFLFKIDEIAEKRSVFFPFSDDPVEEADELIVEEEEFGYEMHVDGEILLDQEDTEEDDEFEEEVLEVEEDLEILEDAGFRDFEVEEDVNDEMEFNEDRITI